MKSKALVNDSMDAYIAGSSAVAQARMQKIRTLVHEIVPAAKETIKYGIPTFTLGKNLLHFGAFQNHIGFYPVPTGHPEFESDFALYKTGKGSIQFPLDKPLPLELITRLIEYRVNELQKKTSKGV
jgi:uncharacterized protein YdhG (YjbR/CyaY superfamily)